MIDPQVLAQAVVVLSAAAIIAAWGAWRQASSLAAELREERARRVHERAELSDDLRRAVLRIGALEQAQRLPGERGPPGMPGAPGRSFAGSVKLPRHGPPDWLTREAERVAANQAAGAPDPLAEVPAVEVRARASEGCCPLCRGPLERPEDAGRVSPRDLADGIVRCGLCHTRAHLGCAVELVERACPTRGCSGVLEGGTGLGTGELEKGMRDLVAKVEAVRESAR